MISFPKIYQFRQVIKAVSDKASWRGKEADGSPIFDRTAINPTLDFVGTVKMHGTNASVVYHQGDIFFQSRKRVISVEKDNAGFAAFGQGVGIECWESIFQGLSKDLGFGIDEDIPVVLYGEWAGGNIQSGVALSGLEKMFVCFALRVGEDWLDMRDVKLDMAEKRVYCINDPRFPSYEMKIDFENPKKVQNDLINLTLAVEKECPVGKFFGKSGVGEGIVWKCVTLGYESSDFVFKVKGKEHSSSKVKTLVEIDPVKLKSIEEFIDRVATTSRFQQGVAHLLEMGLEVSPKNTGVFVKWIVGDSITEELDVLTSSSLCGKDVNKGIGKEASTWFFKELDRRAGL